ncbi:MAG TPA: hypothetical protein VLK82_01370 [Candidatus Tectomicrobia bacterium]|nr:hypothetical protein [Candidatus Tectomicrobia bacterium]
MAASKTGLACWLGLITLLWCLHPLLFSQARGVIILIIIAGGLGLVGWLTGMQLLVVWSGALGLFNLTLVLVLTGQPPSLWVGLSAGITLLALLDGSQRFAYLRLCQVEASVLAVWLGVFMRLTGLTLGVGMALALLIITLPTQGEITSAAGLLTIAGAGLFVGLLALLLLYTSRWPERP